VKSELCIIRVDNYRNFKVELKLELLKSMTLFQLEFNNPINFEIILGTEYPFVGPRLEAATEVIILLIFSLSHLLSMIVEICWIMHCRKNGILKFNCLIFLIHSPK